MSARPRLLLAGIVLLAGAVFLAPEPPGEKTSALTAVGRSMGGIRVGVVDLLFLRAERLRREGRVDEVPGLYSAVLELDPDNVRAVDHLVAVYAYDLRTAAADADERFAWWRRAYERLTVALERHPEDPSLHVRASDLLLEIPADDDVLRPRVLAAHPDAHGLAVDHLLEAARRTATLPKRGRVHLLRLALLLPVWALAAEDAGDLAESKRLIAAGRVLLDAHPGVLGEMTIPLGPHDPELDGPGLSTARSVLEDGLDAVEVLRAGPAGPQDAGRAAIQRFLVRHPEAPLAPLLAPPEPN